MDDVDGFFELDSNPLVHHYLGNRPVKTREDSKSMIAHVLRQYEENGLGRLAIVLKATNEFVGWTGIKLETMPTNGFTRYYDLGYRLIPRFWGQGIATESAIASLNYGFNVIKLEIVYGAAHAENVGSNAVFHKLHFTQENGFLYDGAPHYWYSMKKPQWLKTPFAINP